SPCSSSLLSLCSRIRSDPAAWAAVFALEGASQMNRCPVVSEEVLSLLANHSLVANKKKCFLAQQSVEYLGHMITEHGVAVDLGKVVSVMQWPQPKNVKGVRGFLGLTGYYRKFIKDYGKIARPLTELTKKDSFKWGVEAQQAFDKLKERLTSAPVLALPDFSKSFLI
ncbi:hypothetical protein KIW84_051874, partial [Lathyrus oleraceus]